MLIFAHFGTKKGLTSDFSLYQTIAFNMEHLAGIEPV